MTTYDGTRIFQVHDFVHDYLPILWHCMVLVSITKITKHR
nr:MAG TPA: hypothetical protein [Caudoviricetes sp.]